MYYQRNNNGRYKKHEVTEETIKFLLQSCYTLEALAERHNTSVQGIKELLRDSGLFSDSLNPTGFALKSPIYWIKDDKHKEVNILFEKVWIDKHIKEYKIQYALAFSSTSSVEDDAIASMSHSNTVNSDHGSPVPSDHAPCANFACENSKMSEIVPINYKNTIPYVYACDLHEYLNNPSPWISWINHYITKWNLSEPEDYQIIREGRFKQKHYLLTLELAGRICKDVGNMKGVEYFFLHRKFENQVPIPEKVEVALVETKNELIKIRKCQNGQLAVSGRELHEFLEVETRYDAWFKRMCEYGFLENKDFVVVDQKRSTNNPKNPWTTIIDHAISIDMAKHIGMVQRSEKGRQIREYFIECERRLLAPKPITTEDLLMLNVEKIKELQQQVTRLATHIDDNVDNTAFGVEMQGTGKVYNLRTVVTALNSTGVKPAWIESKFRTQLEKDDYIIQELDVVGGKEVKVWRASAYGSKNGFTRTIVERETKINDFDITGKGYVHFLAKYGNVTKKTAEQILQKQLTQE